MLCDVEVVSWPCFQVIYVFFPAPFDSQITLLSVHFIENFFKRISILFWVVIVQFIHVEGKIRQHLVIELIEVRVFLRILAVNLSQYITENHKHATLIEHVFDFFVGFFSCEEVQSLSTSNKIVFLSLV